VRGPLDERAKRWIAALAGLLATLSGFGGLREFDVWHHLAFGRAFLRDGFPTRDWFLFTWADESMLQFPEWLGSLALHAGWRLGGEPGLVTLVALLVGAAACLLTRDALDRDDTTWGDLAPALLPVALALGGLRLRAVARPEIFGAVLLAWTLPTARRFADGRGRAFLAFPAVALAWTNLHYSVVFGLGVAVLFAFEAGLRAVRSPPAAPERRRATVMAGVVGAAVVLAFANPGGSAVPVGLRFGLGLLGIDAGGAPLEVMRGLDAVKGSILELQPPGWQLASLPLGGLLAVAFFAFAAAWRQGRPVELLLALGAAVLALKAVRFTGVASILLAGAAGRNLVAGAARLPMRWGRARLAGLALLPAAAGWALAVPPLTFTAGRVAELYPTRCVDLLEAAGARDLAGLRLFDSLPFGGYLEWRLDAPAVYQDSRLWWPAGEAGLALQGGSHEIARLDRRWRFDGLLVEHLRVGDASSRQAIQALTWDPQASRDEFALVAFDDAGLLYVRRDGRLGGLAGREYRFVVPARALGAQELSDQAFMRGWRGEMARALGEQPSCGYCRIGLWLGHLALGDLESAEALGPGGVLPRSAHPLGHPGEEALAEALVTLGRLQSIDGLAAGQRGDPVGAERHRRISATIRSFLASAR
jgi:hypothetical protein